jgi:hypothetical protein
MTAAELQARRRDAIAAGLCHLAHSLRTGLVTRDDHDIGAILTNSQTHPGLAIDELHSLAEAVLNQEYTP